MAVVFRIARSQELVRTDELVVQSINDLTERHGFGRMAETSPPAFQRFSLNDDPDGLWIAEEGNQIIGFAFSWMCGDLWFLSQLFVAPGHQGRGIGDELLSRTLRQAQDKDAASRALITFAFNKVSQGLYIRHGLFPRFPIYFYSVAREDLIPRVGSAEMRPVQIGDNPADLLNLASIDRDALGISREKHHRYLLSDGSTTGILLYADGVPSGYAYLSQDGHIGPLAVTKRGDLGAAFRTALNFAGRSSSAEEVSAFIPGPCEAALRIAVETGMRITFPMLLMSTRDFGDWTSYLPRNPGFM
jgi:ribosomal protein S18 acetylase RimI-like enzyme